MKDTKGKPRFDLIDPWFLLDLAKVLTFGAEKYSEESWKEVPTKEYHAAIDRHLNAIRRGKLRDKETGLLHAAHIAADIMFIHWENRHASEDIPENECKAIEADDRRSFIDWRSGPFDSDQNL